MTMNIANVYFQFENYAEAFTYFDNATALKPNNSEAYFKKERCKWLERIKILQQNKVEDYATDTAFKTHLKSEVLSYYAKAIYLDSVENNTKYISRSNLEAMQDMESNYEYYYFSGLFKMNFADFNGALNDIEKSIKVHPVINAYQFAAYIAKKLGQNQKACEYIQFWATMLNPTEETDPFKKHEIADKFCKEIGIEKK